MFIPVEAIEGDYPIAGALTRSEQDVEECERQCQESFCPTLVDEFKAEIGPYGKIVGRRYDGLSPKLDLRRGNRVKVTHFYQMENCVYDPRWEHGTPQKSQITGKMELVVTDYLELEEAEHVLFSSRLPALQAQSNQIPQETTLDSLKPKYREVWKDDFPMFGPDTLPTF